MPTPACTVPDAVVGAADRLHRVVFAYDSGVLINKCSKCGGMFLQRGELNQVAKFLERMLAPKFTSNAKNYSRNALHHFDRLIGLICSKGVFLSVFAFLSRSRLYSTGAPSGHQHS